jgi:hypothetical protein
MKLIERHGEYIVIADTGREVAALDDLAGRQIKISRSACAQASHSHSSGHSLGKVS